METVEVLFFIDVDGELQIDGVNSFGDCCNYGDRDYYVRLGGVAYDWIQRNLANPQTGYNDRIENCHEWPKTGDDGIDDGDNGDDDDDGNDDDGDDDDGDDDYDDGNDDDDDDDGNDDDDDDDDGNDDDGNDGNIEELFHEFDANNSNTLTMNEIWRLWRNVVDDGKKWKQVRNIMKKFDENNDNNLTLEEFTNMMTYEEDDVTDNSKCGRLFTAYDRNGDGNMTIWNLIRLLKMECDECVDFEYKQLKRLARQTRKQYDANNNWTLQLSEFMKLCMDENI